jgi:hypothetical protein
MDDEEVDGDGCSDHGPGRALRTDPPSKSSGPAKLAPTSNWEDLDT